MNSAKFSSSPMMTPPTTAPTIESSPPTMTAGKTLMPMMASELETALTSPSTTPATQDTSAEIAQAIAKTCFTEMPRLCATCWL